MKKLIVLMAILIFLPDILAETVSNSYGDPGDAYLEYSISGPDFSKDTDGPPVHVGTYVGEPIHLSGKMVVSRPEGLKSWVTMKASLADQSVQWPKEGEDNLVENDVVELPFDFTFTLPEDYASDTILGNVRLEACGGTCGVYNIDLRVSVDKKEPAPVETPRSEEKKPASPPAQNNEKCCEKAVGATIYDIGGEVLLAPCGNDNEEYPPSEGQQLIEGDKITTGGDSEAVISFGEGVYNMKSRSSVVMDCKPGKKSTLNMLAGKIWFNVNKMIKDGTLDVTMNQAVAGIKATTFILEEDGTTSKIKVIEGKVEFTSLVDGEKIMVTTGHQASATSAGLSEITAFDIEEESKAWPEVDNFEGKKSSMLLPIIIILSLAAVIGFFVMKKKK